MTVGPGQLNPNSIKNKTITGDKIVDGTIDSTILADDSVTTAKIVAGAVGTTEIADNAVTTAKIAAGAVGTTDIADAAVTEAKLAAAVVAQLGGGANILSTITSTTTVVNTVTQTEVYSGTISANTLGSNDALHLRAVGRYQNVTGSTRNLEITITYGGTAYLVGTISSIASLGSVRIWVMDVYVQCESSSTVKFLSTAFNMTGGSGSSASTGTGLFGTGILYAYGYSTSVSKSNSSSQNLTMEIQHSNNDCYFAYDRSTLMYIPYG